jgi:hypothetical protein
MRTTADCGRVPGLTSPCDPCNPLRQMNFGPGSTSTSQHVNPVIFILPSERLR